MSTKVTDIVFRSDEGGREATITVTEHPYLSSPRVADLPPDMREALLRWLTGEQA